MPNDGDEDLLELLSQAETVEPDPQTLELHGAALMEAGGGASTAYACLKEAAQSGTDVYRDMAVLPKKLLPEVKACVSAEASILTTKGTPSEEVWKRMMGALNQITVSRCGGSREDKLAAVVDYFNPELAAKTASFPDDQFGAAIAKLEVALGALNLTIKEGVGKEKRLLGNLGLCTAVFKAVVRVLYLMDCWRNRNTGPLRKFRQYGRVLARWYFFISTDGNPIPETAAQAPKRAPKRAWNQVDVHSLADTAKVAASDAGDAEDTAVDANILGLGQFLSPARTAQNARLEEQLVNPGTGAGEGPPFSLPSPAGAVNSPGTEDEMTGILEILPRVSRSP